MISTYLSCYGPGVGRAGLKNENTMAEFSHISAENDPKGLSCLYITDLGVQTLSGNSGQLNFSSWGTIAAFQQQATRMSEHLPEITPEVFVQGQLHSWIYPPHDR
jgi:hypothetical protein